MQAICRHGNPPNASQKLLIEYGVCSGVCLLPLSGIYIVAHLSTWLLFMACLSHAINC